MSVFSCRELADDWQIAPLTPVLTAIGGQESLNYDNYPDTEHGAVQVGNTQYPNVPDDYVNVLDVAAGSTWAQFKAIYDTAQAGDVVRLLDGAHTWTGQLWLQNNNGTVDDPIVIMSETPGGAVFSNNSEIILFFGRYHIFCGFAVSATAATTFLDVREGFLRFTSLQCNGGIRDKLRGSTNASPARICYEYDNNVFDGLDNATPGKPIDIRTPDGRQVSNVTNSHYFRIHHNSYVNAPTSTPNSEAVSMGSGYKVDDTAVTNYNLQENNALFHFENNLLDGWAGDEQMVLIKAGIGVIRNNLDVNSIVNGDVIRLSNNILFHGNWHEHARGYMRLSADWVLMAFNYQSRNSATGGECIAMHPGDVGNVDSGPTLDGIYTYKEPSNSIIKHNVFNRYAIQMRTMDRLVVDNDFKANPVACLFEQNAMYSVTMPLTDAPGQGGYRNDDGLYDETAWRASNTWGVNSYINTTLAVTNFIDPTLFDGPGSTYDVPDPTKYYGQPSQIKMPTWWKLP